MVSHQPLSFFLFFLSFCKSFVIFFVALPPPPEGFASHDEWDTIFSLLRHKRKKSKNLHNGSPALPFMLWVPAYHRKSEIASAMDMKRIKNEKTSSLAGLNTRTSGNLASLSEIWEDVNNYIRERFDNLFAFLISIALIPPSFTFLMVWVCAHSAATRT